MCNFLFLFSQMYLIIIDNKFDARLTFCLYITNNTYAQAHTHAHTHTGAYTNTNTHTSLANRWLLQNFWQNKCVRIELYYLVANCGCQSRWSPNPSPHTFGQTNGWILYNTAFHQLFTIRINTNLLRDCIFQTTTTSHTGICM